MNTQTRKRVIDSKDEFYGYVIAAAELVADVEIDDEVTLADICESSLDAIEIAGEIENKLHVVIDDKCLEEVLINSTMTLLEFSELLRANILPA